MTKRIMLLKKMSKNNSARVTRPPFGYFGSKHKLANELCRILPPHNAWVEAFCGSSALTLAKPPVPIEVINDIDGEIVNFFEQLRNNQERLCRNIALTPYARHELELARTVNVDTTPLERARRFLVEAMMSVNSVFGSDRGGFSFSTSYSRSNREARVNRWYNLPDRIAQTVERLRDVRIENVDARKLLREFLDRPATLVYLDPPYLADRTNGYKNDANVIEFHEELLELSNQAKCMIFISGYDNTLYNKMLSKVKGWTNKRIETTTRDASGKIHKRTEIVWMNRLFVKAQRTGRVPIRLSVAEKRLNKLNPVR